MSPRVWVAILLVFVTQTEAQWAQTHCGAGQYGICVDVAPDGGDYCRNVELICVMNCAACCRCQSACIASNNPPKQNTCMNCPVGKAKNTYGTDGIEACIACPDGTLYEYSTGLAVCPPCAAGKAGRGGFCAACPPGSWSGEGQAECTPCAAGQYSTVHGGVAGSCTQCPSGVTSLAGASYCAPEAQPICPAGKVRDICKAVSFTSTTGYYCSAYNGVTGTRNAQCVAEGACWACCDCANQCTGQCVNGCASRGGICIDSAAGYYKSTAGGLDQKICPPGTWSAAGATACTQCAVGKYSSVWGAQTATTCLSCAAGTTTCLSGSATCDATCTACAAGKFNAQGAVCGPCAGGATCASCEAGKYAPQSGATVCQSCAAGTTTCSAGMSACEFGCNNAGYTGSDSSCGTSCPACVPGKYKPTRGSMACAWCDPGTYGVTSAATSSASCLSCPASTPSTAYYGSSSVAACQRLCPPGQTGALDGVAACTACPAGTYKDSTGSAACISCEGGTYSAAVGATSCVSCDLTGEYDMQTLVRPTGMYWMNDVPYYSNGVQITAFAREGGTKKADCVCGAGCYKVTGCFGGGCVYCPAGKYKSASPLVYVSATCSDTCIDCPVGTYTNYAGSDVCSSCNSGSTPNYGTCTTGNVYAGCIPLKTCAAGYTGPDAYCDTCSACAPGWFKAVTGNAACGACAAGKFSSAGATTCTACAAGTFSVSGGMCTACAAGTYSSTSGATACAACNSGATSPAGSSTNLACVCVPGRYLW